jgi:hypothetical protein
MFLDWWIFWSMKYFIEIENWQKCFGCISIGRQCFHHIVYPTSLIIIIIVIIMITITYIAFWYGKYILLHLIYICRYFCSILREPNSLILDLPTDFKHSFLMVPTEQTSPQVRFGAESAPAILYSNLQNIKKWTQSKTLVTPCNFFKHLNNIHLTGQILYHPL